MKKAQFIYIFLLIFQSLSGQVTVDFTSNTRVGCGLVQVVFQNKSTGPIKSYSWNLGGVTSILENPSRIFLAPGKYKICLTVTALDGKQETLCKNDFIEVKPSFKADFSSNQTIICSGTAAQFQDLTISPNGKITTLIWDLGGSTGTVQLTNSVPVSSVYRDPGSYPITLYAKDEAGCESTVTKKDVLRVLQKPEIKINNLPPVICNLPAEIKISNLSVNTPEIMFKWIFGNGVEFTGYDPPIAQYPQEGKYDLKVIATNSVNNCADTLFRPGAIVVEKISKFSVSKVQACPNELLQFTTSNSTQPDSHQWNFGDGNNSTESNPQHAFALAGCYTVSHTTVYQGCTSTHVFETCIRINEVPIASFVLDKNKGCQLPVLVQASNNSTGANQWAWKSNGVTLSNEQNPLLRFDNPGNYPIQLEATSPQGCKATAEQGPVEVYKIQPVISSGAISGCGPLIYILEHASISADPITLVKWTVFTPVPKVNIGADFRVVIPEVGRYDVRLTVENSLGCKDSIDAKEWIRVGRAPVTSMEFPNQQCFGIPLNVSDKSDNTADEFMWDFGDGSPPVFSKDVAKVYLEPKTYIISHQAFFNGCGGNSVSAGVTILGAKADFEIINNCEQPALKVFKNKSIAADSVHWDFGLIGTDQDTSNQGNPNYQYSTPGNYPVLLTAFHKASGCQDTSTITAIVSDLKASFTLNQTESCLPAQIQIINNSKNVSSYKYEFADAEISKADTSDPIIKYNKGGNYFGRLIGTDVLGCKDTFQFSRLYSNS